MTKRQLASVALTSVCALAALGFLLRASRQGTSATQFVAADRLSSEVTGRFLFDKVHRDPEDFIAQNMLASYLLVRVRETGSSEYLDGALRAAHASLLSVPAIRNFAALSALARAEIAAHDFNRAREHGKLLTELDPGTLGSYAVLTDALLELGEYARADEAIQHMRRLGGNNTETEIRLGRILFQQSDTAGAKRHFLRALGLAMNIAPPPPETVAWCRWQMGEMEFAEGNFRSAESYYRQALATYSGYVQALGSLGRVRAALGDLPGAIELYEHAVRRIPDPTFVAALGDLYLLAGRNKEANDKYDLVEQIGRLSDANGNRYNRQIALFHADHNRNAEGAYRDAQKEYADRKDLYGADTLAWTALKAGKIAEAQRWIPVAMRLNTRDAKLFYHAGMIAQAAHNESSARQYLRRALALNPQFDPLQAKVARNALAN